MAKFQYLKTHDRDFLPSEQRLPPVTIPVPICLPQFKRFSPKEPGKIVTEEN